MYAYRANDVRRVSQECIPTHGTRTTHACSTAGRTKHTDTDLQPVHSVFKTQVSLVTRVHQCVQVADGGINALVCSQREHTMDALAKVLRSCMHAFIQTSTSWVRAITETCIRQQAYV